MSDSPRSDRSQTRFSTPVSELDDHRDQPVSLPPRIDPTGAGNSGIANSATRNSQPGTRRGTFVDTTASAPQPSLLEVNEALRAQGMSSRDFEHAIVDDDTPVAEVRGHARHASSTSPVARRNTFRRPTVGSIEYVRTSRASSTSTSSRSISPPNSVDAFADPSRRRRAGTVTSNAPSDLQPELQRTISGGTHQRRPNMSEANASHIDRASLRSAVEEDICFPQSEETGKTFKIDYEELEEFVVENDKRTPVQHPFANKWHEQKSKSVPRVFSDLRPLPKITTETPNGIASAFDSNELGDLDEKFPDISRIPTAHREGVNEPVSHYTFFSSELDDTIHSEQLGGLLMPDETFRDLFEFGPEGGVWWLDMLNCSQEEVSVVCKAFGVHPLTREDILFQEAREKVELFKSYYFVCFRSFYQEDKTSEDYLEPINVYAVVFREGLLTFTFTNSPHCTNVRTRISKLRDYLSLSADWICYALIDNIVDSFGPVIREIERETDAIEDSVFTARLEDSRAVLRSIGDSRKRIMTLMRLLGGKADVIKGFAKRCNEKYEVAPRPEVGLYLSDIQDHVVTMMSTLSHSEKMLSRCHSNYLAQISVDNITQGNKVNETLGKVTLIGTILVPLNLICGLFGMNVPVPGMNSGSLGWFFGILGIILAFSVACLALAKRMHAI
jgi:magnesium transporter